MQCGAVAVNGGQEGVGQHAQAGLGDGLAGQGLGDAGPQQELVVAPHLQGQGGEGKKGRTAAGQPGPGQKWISTQWRGKP